MWMWLRDMQSLSRLQRPMPLASVPQRDQLQPRLRQMRLHRQNILLTTPHGRKAQRSAICLQEATPFTFATTADVRIRQQSQLENLLNLRQPAVFRMHYAMDKAMA